MPVKDYDGTIAGKLKTKGRDAGVIVRATVAEKKQGVEVFSMGNKTKAAVKCAKKEDCNVLIIGF